MKHVIIVGCGVIGAMIAYELSQLPDLAITVLDRQPPAQAATGAALGVLVGAISQKQKGRAWTLRQTSIRRYQTLIPELEPIAGPLPWNQQGILMLCYEPEAIAHWQQLAHQRQTQGWNLEIWPLEHLQATCPQIALTDVVAAIYSPDDRQIDPTALTQALVTAATQRGVTFDFTVDVTGLQISDDSPTRCTQVHTTQSSLAADWVIVAAGLGSRALTRPLPHPIDVRPVLGQALRVRLPQPLGDPQFQPVITGHDIHLVPLEQTCPDAYEYWVGATVEFPDRPDATPEELTPREADRQTLWQGAIALWPGLSAATVVETWSGLRPRPHERPAPIIERSLGCDNLLVATGHYRNGILLAPATALAIKEMVLAG